MRQCRRQCITSKHATHPNIWLLIDGKVLIQVQHFWRSVHRCRILSNLTRRQNTPTYEMSLRKLKNDRKAVQIKICLHRTNLILNQAALHSWPVMIWFLLFCCCTTEVTQFNLTSRTQQQILHLRTQSKYTSLRNWKLMTLFAKRWNSFISFLNWPSNLCVWSEAAVYACVVQLYKSGRKSAVLCCREMADHDFAKCLPTPHLDKTHIFQILKVDSLSDYEI